MKLDNELLALIDNLVSGSSEPEAPLWNDTQGYIKLSDLKENPYRTLHVKPRRRTYLKATDAGYDWASGKEFVVVDRNSGFYGQVVACDEADMLKRYDYDTISIQYNTNVRPLEMVL